jgi:hypothetical protein
MKCQKMSLPITPFTWHIVFSAISRMFFDRMQCAETVGAMIGSAWTDGRPCDRRRKYTVAMAVIPR